MINGVCYCRVSRPKQGQSGLGLKAQLDAVRSFAQAYGYKIINVFIEIESGKKDNRPKMQKALRCCKWHNAVLLIAKIDRLTRNLHFVTDLEKSKMSFKAVDNPDASSVVIHILTAIAQYERELISKRIKEALQAAKQKGVELGKYGKYVLSVRNKRRAAIRAMRLRPLIVELISEGFTSVRTIATELNKRGIPAFKPGAIWHKTSVFNLLKRLKISTAKCPAGIQETPLPCT